MENWKKLSIEKTKKGIKKNEKSENWKMGKSENSPIEIMKKGGRKNKVHQKFKIEKNIEIWPLKEWKIEEIEKNLKNESI